MKAIDFLKEMDGLPEETVLQYMPESMRNAAPYQKQIQPGSAADMQETGNTPQTVRGASGRARRMPYYLIGGCAAACVCGLILLFHHAKPEPVQTPAAVTSEAVTEVQNTTAVTEAVTAQPEPAESNVSTILPSNMTLLPSLDAQSYDEFQRTLRESELLGQICLEFSDTVPAGRVIRSEPEGACRVEKGSTVIVHLSRGKEGAPVTVPRFIDCSIKDACMLAEIYGLNAVFADCSSDAPAGSIVEQSMKPDTVTAANSEIILYVSNSDPEGKNPKKTSGTVQMPDIAEKEYAAISRELLTLGLSVKVTWEYSDTVPANIVIGSDPAGPCDVDAGALISVRCSLGRDMSADVADGTPYSTVRLPEFQGYLYDDVRDRLTELGLVTEIQWEYSDTVTEKKVIATVPEGRNEVKKGSTVLLRVAYGTEEEAEKPADAAGKPGMVRLPEIRGKYYGDVQRQLKDLGHSWIETTFEYSDTVPYGMVISSTPEGGIDVEDPLIIYLRVSKGIYREPINWDEETADTQNPNMVRLPEMLGKHYEDVKERLTELGLETKLHFESSDTAAEFTVIASTPESGTDVEKGSVITLRISMGKTVPYYVGDDIKTARRLAEESGLKVVVNYVNDTAPADTILMQNLEPRTPIEENLEIVFYVSNGNPEPMEMQVNVSLPANVSDNSCIRIIRFLETEADDERAVSAADANGSLSVNIYGTGRAYYRAELTNGADGSTAVIGLYEVSFIDKMICQFKGDPAENYEMIMSQVS